MQDTPNPHLEAERRDAVLAVETNERQANRAAQMLAHALLNSDLGFGRGPSCASKRALVVRHGGFSK